jgi:hypothetical protein
VFQGERVEVIGGDARSIVHDFDSIDPVVLEPDLERRCVRIEGIFNEFFDYGAEINDDLSGLDLMDLKAC